MGKLLKLLAPFVSLLPKLQKPRKRISFKEKLLWTIFALIYFLIASQVPLYGMEKLDSMDSLDFMRLVTASNRGTLMELGISPIISASMVMHFLAGSRLISVNMSDEDERTIFEGLQNLFGLIMTIAQAVVYVMSGNYGDPEIMGTKNCILIVVQLFISGVIILLLDELLSSDYGFGSAISLFIATNISESVIWSMLSPVTYNHNGTEFEGAILNFFHLLGTRENKLGALYDGFFRTELPNMSNVIATFIMLGIVVYLSELKVNIPLAYNQSKAQAPTYPIKLFYTSITPMFMSTTLIQMVIAISRTLFTRFPTSFIVNLFGSWEVISSKGILRPVGGIAYYLSRPRHFSEIFYDPIHAIISIALTVFICSFFSRQWLNISRSSPYHIKQQLTEQRIHIKGFRGGESSYNVLDHYIPIAASFGGMVIALVAVLADLLGCIGSGTGLLLAANTITEYYEKFQKDYKRSNGSYMTI